MKVRKETISYAQTGCFSHLAVDYIENKDALHPFYKYPFKPESFAKAIKDKQEQPVDRVLLKKVLTEQYSSFSKEEMMVTGKHIEYLSDDKTFVIVTAHQPNLFLGPLYIPYKIISAINLAERLNKEFPANRFVPVFWMGSEDHDTDELGHINLFNKTLTWNDGVKGAFGRRKTQSLQPVLDELKTILGESEQATQLLQLLNRAYKDEKTITAATRRILHDLFGQYGLVVLDADNAALKQKFAHVMREDLISDNIHRLIEQTTHQLDKNYKVQAKPRDINLFYLIDETRNRIIKEGEKWKVLNTDIEFSSFQLEEELRNRPERFSPNVILRPLFQETVLPSVAFIGGGAEIAYYMELKSTFEKFNLNFPILVLRNSALWIDANQSKKWSNVGLTCQQLFENTDSLVNEFVKQHSDSSISVTEEQSVSNKIFDTLKLKAEKFDKSILPMIEAENTRFNKFLGNYEDKLLKAEKKKYDTTIQQIRSVKEKLFPNNSLQERYDNFIPYYLKYGQSFISALKENIDPFELKFTVISEE